MSDINQIFFLSYIDPGSGAMLLQWVLAAVIGAGIYFRRFFVTLFRRLIGRKDAGTQEPPQHPESGEDKKPPTCRAAGPPEDRRRMDADKEENKPQISTDGLR